MENSELIKQMLKEMLQKTIEKKIYWLTVNANAIRWIKKENGNSTTVTLQKQPSPPVPANSALKENYVLTIQPPTTTAPTPSTQINSAIERDFREVLAEIFAEANKESARLANEKKIEVIKNLLKDI